MFKNAEGKREINGHPDMIRKTCEDSLQRLGTEVIDLYYLHRWDRNVPIEDSVGALSDLVSQGKIRSIGLSEVSSDTLRKAHAVHPVSALQTEYSLWSRNAEISVLETCKDLGVAFVAFSPLARGYLTGTLTDVNTLAANDLRRNMPRFNDDNYSKNLSLLDGFKPIAERNDCSLAQLSMAWLLAKGKHIIPIPGTTSIAHLEENVGASDVSLTQASIDEMDEIINQNTVHGPRYNANTQVEIDTEEFVQ
jgi:aryl-alcohol dehydrogenase-like predicted oxidoreductase